MSEYRYSIDDDGVIRRGKIQRYGDDDTWRNYWDGDQMIAFVDYYSHGMTLLTRGNDVSDLGERVMAAYERSSDKDRYLTLAAKALGATAFLTVYLDQGAELLTLWWGSDVVEMKQSRDEIEACYHNEVYRIVVDQHLIDLTTGQPVWLEDESDYTEYYGEDSASAELARQFDLDAFPADALV